MNIAHKEWLEDFKNCLEKFYDDEALRQKLVFRNGNPHPFCNMFAPGGVRCMFRKCPKKVGFIPKGLKLRASLCT